MQESGRVGDRRGMGSRRRESVKQDCHGGRDQENSQKVLQYGIINFFTMKIEQRAWLQPLRKARELEVSSMESEGSNSTSPSIDHVFHMLTLTLDISSNWVLFKIIIV